MSPSHPDTIDLWLYADTNRSVTGRLPLSSLSRLSESLVDSGGEAEFDLAFDRDPKNRARVRGNVRAVLMLQCQRCLEAVPWTVSAPIHLVAVTGLEEAERLPEECSPLLIEQPKIRPAELVEDELLLSLPLVPMHPGDSCRPARYESGEGREEEQEASVEANPFAVLAGLKNR